MRRENVWRQNEKLYLYFFLLLKNYLEKSKAD